MRRLGIGMLPDEYRETVLQSNSDNDDHDREGRRTGFVDEGIGTNMAALLRSVVLQNELVLAALKRLEEAMLARPQTAQAQGGRRSREPHGLPHI